MSRDDNRLLKVRVFPRVHSLHLPLLGPRLSYYISPIPSPKHDILLLSYPPHPRLTGIWLSPSAYSPTIVMDVEGTDGRERGEDQDFERKSALFSLAGTEVLLVNLWYVVVGRRRPFPRGG